MAKRKEQSVDDLPLVAIDLGSHSIKAMAAVSLGPDTLHILGVEKNTKFPCVDRGMVTNSSSAAFMIKEVLQLLANRIQAKELPSAFVIMGGRNMKIVNLTCKRDLIREQYLTLDLLEKTKSAYILEVEKRRPDVAVLDLIPTYYSLDGKEQDDCPLPSQQATLLEIHYTAFVCKKEFKQKLQDSLDRTSIFVEGSFVRPDALISALAEDSDTYQNGCAVIDMGAQTTTLSIYKGNQYIANKVVNTGGWNITRAIEQMGISTTYAEQLKCQYGFTSPEEIEKNYKMSIPDINHPGQTIQITTQELTETIQMKLDEAILPILEALKPHEDRISIIYITGGACKLQGMQEYIQKRTKVRVEYGSHAHLLDRQADDEYFLPDYSALVGTLLLAADYRKAHRQTLPDKKTKWDVLRNFRKKFDDATLTLFTDKNE